MYDPLKASAWIKENYKGGMIDWEVFRAGKRMVCLNIEYWKENLTFVLKEGYEVNDLIADLKKLTAELERQHSMNPPSQTRGE